jgi:hypothetical protein
VGRAGYVPAVLVPLALLGLAVGLTLPAATSAATRSSQGEDAGLVSGLLNTSRQFGSSLGLSLLYTLGTAGAVVTRLSGDEPEYAAAVPPGYAHAALIGVFIALASSLLALTFIRRTAVEQDVTQGGHRRPGRGSA